ncbi:MAG: hypothetical protein ACK40G_01015 [Cytophagaceae bacterium]
MLIVIPSLVLLLVVLVVAYFINITKQEEPEVKEKETVKTINLYKEGVGYNLKELKGIENREPFKREEKYTNIKVDKVKKETL